jgi:hypothetical protein
MKKILFFVLILIASSCSKYITIDETVNSLTPPVTLVSRSAPNYYGDRVYKVRDGNGKTYTCRDNSLSSVIPGSVIVPLVKPPFRNIDKVLMKLKSPVSVIGKGGKYGQILKVKDRKGKIVTIEDITLADYQVGDTIK